MIEGEYMRIVVAGCRDYDNYEEAEAYIDQHIKNIKEKIVVVSGGCRGADRCGERYAERHGLLTEKYLPNWERYGRAAGPIRNREMVKNCDIILCFRDGKSRGTNSLIRLAKQLKRPIHIMDISNTKKETSEL